eukprot:GHVP01059429.1.p1 GENE.GHVP01059429.1~~GHVP01059429.1.p1  ORF type:complete len:134 (+),score=10.48 GHVP01059429.1:287-688(+)
MPLIPIASATAVHPTSSSTPIKDISTFIPKSSGIIIGLEPPLLPKVKKGFTTSKVRAYRKWCNDLKSLKKIEIFPNPKRIISPTLIWSRKRMASYNFGPLRRIIATLSSLIPKINEIIHRIAQFEFVAKIDLL